MNDLLLLSTLLAGPKHGYALKKQIALIQADTKMPAKDKKAALDEMNEALKTTPTVQFPDNVTLVTKSYDKLSAALH